MNVELHRQLSQLNHARLAPRLPSADWRDELAQEHRLRVLEGTMIEAERAQISARAATAPRDPARFRAWFEALEQTGPGQHDALFDWLAEHATLDQMTWFLRHEVAGEAGFDDLVALAQLGADDQPKLELARNYWDELGRGHAGGMHGPMLAKLATALDLDAVAARVPVVVEALALGNVMLALAHNRRYAYQALGALGVIELTAPARAALVNQGLRRLGVAPDIRQYYALHATLDIKHSEAWNAEVLVPIATQHPEAIPALAEGALLRLEAGRRCFDAYRAHLWRNEFASAWANDDQQGVRGAA